MIEKPRLLDRLRDRIRLKHYSIRTEKTYLDWNRRFILFHNKKLWRENTQGLTRSGAGSMFFLPESVCWIQDPVKLGDIILMTNHCSEP